MGYTVDLKEDHLDCRDEATAAKAVEVITADEWIHPYHMQVMAYCRSNPPRDNAWCLDIDHFQGDHWNEDNARKVWLALAPFMANTAILEFEGEDGTRWRVRWSDGRVFEEYVQEVVWAVHEEITAPAEEKTS